MLVNKVCSKDKVHTGLDMQKLITMFSYSVAITYSLDQMPWLPFISSRNFVWLLFESDYYLRAGFIKLGMEDEEIHCLKESGVAADARESIPRDTATLTTVTDTELKESGPLRRC